MSSYPSHPSVEIANRCLLYKTDLPVSTQYFSVLHLFQLDSSGFQWILLYSTGIYLCVNFFIFIYYILSTFQVIPGCSRSFQVIPVDSSTV